MKDGAPFGIAGIWENWKEPASGAAQLLQRMTFKKGIGNNGNGGGRPRGARNKLSHAFVTALAKDFEQHGEAVIKILRRESPSDYCRLVAGLVPKEVDLSVTNRQHELKAWLGWVTEVPSVLQPISKSIEPAPPALAFKKPEAPPRLRHEPWAESEHQEPIAEKPKLKLEPHKAEKF
jgi:hypothetical protein